MLSKLLGKGKKKTAKYKPAKKTAKKKTKKGKIIKAGEVCEFC